MIKRILALALKSGCPTLSAAKGGVFLDTSQATRLETGSSKLQTCALGGPTLAPSGRPAETCLTEDPIGAFRWSRKPHPSLRSGWALILIYPRPTYPGHLFQAEHRQQFLDILRVDSQAAVALGEVPDFVKSA